MVAVVLTSPAGAKKKLETGQRKTFSPIKLDLDDADKAKRKRGSARVYEELREDILWVRIDPGTALDEVALARRFELSRTPVREALVMLAAEDLVTFLPNRTSIVAPHMLDNMSEYLDNHLLLARSVARQAACFRTKENLADIKEAAQRYEDALESNDVYQIFGADLAFHRAVSASCRNHFSRKFHDLSIDYGRRAFVLHYFPAFNQQERQTALVEHRALVDALEAGDQDRSDAAISNHLRSEMNVIKRTLDPKMGFDMNVSDLPNHEVQND